jgi:hypothetical protein
MTELKEGQIISPDDALVGDEALYIDHDAGGQYRDPDPTNPGCGLGCAIVVGACIVAFLLYCTYFGWVIVKAAWEDTFGPLLQ